MIHDPRQTDPLYVHGWAAILHRHDHLPIPLRLMDLSATEFLQVGSKLPLQEFSTPLEVYRQFMQTPGLDFGIPRGFLPFDAINLFEDELNLSVTFILVPKEFSPAYLSAGTCFLQDNELPLALASRPEPFPPFTFDK